MPNARKLSSNKNPAHYGNNVDSRFQVHKVGDLTPEETSRKSSRVEHSNQHTYHYDTQHPQPSLGQLTREAFPKLENYRDPKSIQDGFIRPTVDELLATHHEKKIKQDEDEEDGPALRGKVVKFTWLEGVLMRCLLNIWGVMLFLRLSWCIGQTGTMEGILLITLANSVTFITTFSMSAVSTNGQIRAGGIYYMISRSLGPEFGAAIGLMFTVANSVAVALNIVGFCESLNDLLKDNGVEKIIDGGTNDIRVVGIGVLIAILILALVGMDWVTRAQMFLLVVLIAAQVNFIVGTFIGPVDTEEKAKGFIGYGAKTFATNFWSDYRTAYGKDDDTPQSFFSVFGVFFPSVTGIVAGANLSGDLKDPASAIPKGTLLAITITYISYIIYTLMLGGCAIRGATGNVTQYEITTNATEWIKYPDTLPYDYCEPGVQECDYGLIYSAQVMELISSWGPLIYMGCFAATLSSAIASLVGAPRVFQALSKDKLYPFIHFFAAGYGANNDPVRGYCLVFVVSLGCLLIGKLNAIAPIQSNFFLMAYCLINFSCFHATITKSPGWRPSFKYYNAYVSLLGCVLCVAVMFLMSWIMALVTVGCVTFLYLFVSYRNPDVNWGSSTQAQSYNSALKSVQSLNAVGEHVKNFRPQVLVLSGMPSSRPPLIDFANLIVKNLSLMVCAHIEKDSVKQKKRNALTHQANSWLAQHKKKGFYALIEDKSFENGCKSLMQLCGLGKLRPNMVLMGYKQNWQKCDRQDLKEYFNVIHEALDMHLAVALLRVQEGLDYTGLIDEEEPAPPQEIDSKDKNQNGRIRNISESRASDEDDSMSDVSSPPSSPKIESPTEQTPAETPTAPVQPKRKRKHSLSALYTKPGGGVLPRDVLTHVTRFHIKQKKGTIDVWWLYDDGGLTLLLPYILTTRAQFAGCTLRIFVLTSRKDDLQQEQRNMAALLAKFRIDYSDVIVIHDVQKKAQEQTKKEFDDLIAPFKSKNSDDDGISITDDMLASLREKTNRYLRIRELLLTHSKESTFIVMTLPMPRKGTAAPLYMSWLEMMTKDMPPLLIVRGNQTSVLTFYS